MKRRTNRAIIMNYSEFSVEQLEQRQGVLQDNYAQIKEARLNLDITRGKPSAEQLDLSNEIDGILQGFFLLQDGTDVRNYGGILGIPEARQLGADILCLQPSEVLVGGNSSLTLMYNMIAHLIGAWEEESRQSNSKVKFLCLVPGYDRHFTICEHFDIEMINVEFLTDGPDLDTIEAMLERDPMIKGIWCVPKYSNPTGHTYNTVAVKRFAQLKIFHGRSVAIVRRLF